MRFLLASPVALALLLSTAPALAQDPHAGHAPAPPADAHAGHGPPSPGVLIEEPPEHHLKAALGDYGMTREASGTAWQPEVSSHMGLHVQRGDWQTMSHAVLNAVYDDQDGPRGGARTFVAGMAMASGSRPVGDAGRLQLRAMLSPDPLMGKRGYPLLLAAGESADGLTPLVDRQHPHDLFMELSASYSHRLASGGSAFVYVGLPGEPAFGPPAFMHRLSIMDSPEAPITHHWLDSTHIVFGVITAGYVHGNWKLEASRFKGREPDEDRYDIENAKLDSTAVRLSWNPTPRLALQASWADQESPEALEPDEDVERWSASAIYTRPFGREGWWSTTLAWGRRSSGHDDLDAFALESAVKPSPAWTLFARAERVETNELLSIGGHHGPTFTVAKASVGVVRDVRLAERVTIGVGGLYAINRVPAGLEPSYGGDPDGAMAFLRLKIE